MWQVGRRDRIAVRVWILHSWIQIWVINIYVLRLRWLTVRPWHYVTVSSLDLLEWWLRESSPSKPWLWIVFHHILIGLRWYSHLLFLLLVCNALVALLKESWILIYHLHLRLRRLLLLLCLMQLFDWRSNVSSNSLQMHWDCVCFKLSRMLLLWLTSFNGSFFKVFARLLFLLVLYNLFNGSLRLHVLIYVLPV